MVAEIVFVRKLSCKEGGSAVAEVRSANACSVTSWLDDGMFSTKRLPNSREFLCRFRSGRRGPP